MRVSDAMTRDVRVCNPNESIREVAKAMAEIDAGSIPVGENDKLVGMITDRDIAIRAIAAGKGPDTPVEVMSTDKVLYCHEDDELDRVAKNMGEVQVRRLPVVNREKRLVGIVSIGDLAQKQQRSAGKAVSDVARKGGSHRQSEQA
jgi:CBS domain-containing protein